MIHHRNCDVDGHSHRHKDGHGKAGHDHDHDLDCNDQPCPHIGGHWLTDGQRQVVRTLFASFRTKNSSQFQI